jgi:Ca2+-binding RTX toxin-like protein
MYRQVNPTELFRERQLALLKETDNRRLARRLRVARRTPKEGSLMRRTIMLMATMTLATFVVGGVAFALDFTCDGVGDQSNLPGECRGTTDADSITGTSHTDFIDALAGNDTVNARAGDDVVLGREGQDTIHGRSGEDEVVGEEGSDTLFGEGDHDTLSGQGGANVYFGASGPDRIVAKFVASVGGTAGEEIYAGPGNDLIFARDELQDIIDCGGGSDEVANDPIDQVDPNCEIHSPTN